MAAADFWRFLPTPLDAGSPRANRQTSPGITHSPSRLCLSDIRHGVPCKYWALRLLACSSNCVASYPLAVRQSSALPIASSGSHLTIGTLAVRLTLPLAGCVEGLAPPSECALPGAPSKRAGAVAPALYCAGMRQSMVIVKLALAVMVEVAESVPVRLMV
jgi:hypothetical protein